MVKSGIAIAWPRVQFPASAFLLHLPTIPLRKAFSIYVTHLHEPHLVCSDLGVEGSLAVPDLKRLEKQLLDESREERCENDDFKV